jgi:hypothetical protein
MTGIDVDDLIDRLRKASAGSRELDAAFAVAQSGSTDIYAEGGRVRVPGCGSISGHWVEPARYTTSLSAVARVVPAHLVWTVSSGSMAWVGRPDARVRGFERAATSELAFCIALLVALRTPLDRPEGGT